MEQLLAWGGTTNSTKVADGLINEFATLPAVLKGSPRRQLLAAGNDQMAIRSINILRETMSHVLKVRLTARPVVSNWKELLEYLYADMASLITERFRVLHLNSRNMLIRDEVMSEGSINQANVYIREVIHRAMDLGSASIILVHNHPSGDPAPSNADIDLTRALMEAAKWLGIALHDHLIIASTGHMSMKALGLI